MLHAIKTIVAATTNLAALNLGSDATRIHGEHHWWTPDGTTYFIMFHTPQWQRAKTFLDGAGAVSIPHHLNHAAQVGPVFAFMCPASAGVTATDPSWQALAKLAQVAGSMFNPEEL